MFNFNFNNLLKNLNITQMVYSYIRGFVCCLSKGLSLYLMFLLKLLELFFAYLINLVPQINFGGMIEKFEFSLKYSKISKMCEIKVLTRQLRASITVTSYFTLDFLPEYRTIRLAYDKVCQVHIIDKISKVIQFRIYFF